MSETIREIYSEKEITDKNKEHGRQIRREYDGEEIYVI